MTDHAKRQEYLDEYRDITKWTNYACKSFGAVFVVGSLILMMIGQMMKAFPLLSQWHDEKLNGMDLRDYFAAKAMQAMLSEGFIPQQGIDYKSFNGALHDLYASQAYKMADAMLEARKQ